MGAELAGWQPSWLAADGHDDDGRRGSDAWLDHDEDVHHGSGSRSDAEGSWSWLDFDGGDAHQCGRDSWLTAAADDAPLLHLMMSTQNRKQPETG